MSTLNYNVVHNCKGFCKLTSHHQCCQLISLHYQEELPCIPLYQATAEPLQVFHATPNCSHKHAGTTLFLHEGTICLTAKRSAWTNSNYTDTNIIIQSCRTLVPCNLRSGEILDKIGKQERRVGLGDSFSSSTPAIHSWRSSLWRPRETMKARPYRMYCTPFWTHWTPYGTHWTPHRMH